MHDDMARDYVEKTNLTAVEWMAWKQYCGRVGLSSAAAMRMLMLDAIGRDARGYDPNRALPSAPLQAPPSAEGGPSEDDSGTPNLRAVKR